MLEMLTSAGFVDVKIQIKENAADIISGWMPGSGAEKYVTSAYVTATKPIGGQTIRDTVRQTGCCTGVDGKPDGLAAVANPSDAPAVGC